MCLLVCTTGVSFLCLDLCYSAEMRVVWIRVISLP